MITQAYLEKRLKEADDAWEVAFRSNNTRQADYIGGRRDELRAQLLYLYVSERKI